MVKNVKGITEGSKGGGCPSGEISAYQRKNLLKDNGTPEQDLSGVVLFSSLPPEIVQNLENACKWWRTYLPGSSIIEFGNDGDDVFFLIEGIAQVLNYADSGRAVAFAVIEKGDYFGELAAIDAKPRSATIVAKTSCFVACLPAKDFLHLATTHPQITLSIFRKLAGIIRASDERIVDLSVLGAEQRICIELLQLAKSNPNVIRENFEIYPVPTQKALSRKIGATRETVARIFSHLFSEGIIERKSNVLYIRNRQKLEEIALSKKPVNPAKRAKV